MSELTEINNEIESAQEEDSTIQLITFHVNGQEYGINIMSIREIKGWTPTTLLPNTPEYVLGVINLRGSVIPIIDLSFRFGMGKSKPGQSHVVMIVSVHERIMGILVDAVSDIITIPCSEVRDIPSVGTQESEKDVLSGVIEVKERMISVLALENVFDQNIAISEISQQIVAESNELVELDDQKKEDESAEIKEDKTDAKEEKSSQNDSE